MKDSASACYSLELKFPEYVSLGARCRVIMGLEILDYALMDLILGGLHRFLFLRNFLLLKVFLGKIMNQSFLFLH